MRGPQVPYTTQHYLSVQQLVTLITLIMVGMIMMEPRGTVSLRLTTIWRLQHTALRLHYPDYKPARKVDGVVEHSSLHNIYDPFAIFEVQPVIYPADDHALCRHPCGHLQY